MPLTDIACRRAQPRAKRYKLTDSLGLVLRVTPRSGGKYWVWRYRFDGKARELALGTYPRLSLVQARIERDRLRATLDSGGDPAMHRFMAAQAAAVDRATTFEAVAQEWLVEFTATRSKKYAKQVAVRLQADILPALGRRPIKEITAPELLAALKRPEKRGVYETVRRLKQYCGMIFRFGIARGYCEFDITPGLRGAIRSPQRGHYATIESAELPALLRCLTDPAMPVGLQTRLAVRFMLLTFVRTSELIGARWSEIDFEKAQWHIAGERMKKKRPHIVPLSRQALACLQGLRAISTGDIIFASRLRRGRSISNMTILQALKRMGWEGKMTGHGFRALATTILREELDYPKDYIDIQLAHAPEDDVWAAYDRAKFLRQRTEMMQAWGDYVARAEAIAQGLAVPPIHVSAPQSTLELRLPASRRHLN